MTLKKKKQYIWFQKHFNKINKNFLKKRLRLQKIKLFKIKYIFEKIINNKNNYLLKLKIQNSFNYLLSDKFLWKENIELFSFFRKKFQKFRFFYDTIITINLCTLLINPKIFIINIKYWLPRTKLQNFLYNFIFILFKCFFNKRNFKYLLGIKYNISGRINRRLRARSLLYAIGIAPLQQLNLNIQYCFDHILTRYGVYGVKLWLIYQ